MMCVKISGTYMTHTANTHRPGAPRHFPSPRPPPLTFLPHYQKQNSAKSWLSAGLLIG